MVFGYKIKGTKAGKGRQLGKAHISKSVANDEAETWREQGYVASVQPTFREPKYP